LFASILAPVLVIGVLVLVHELGHFLAAKRAGIRVETFSIGFGPALVSFERGGTVYKIAWVPFGGYVKMAGEDPDEQGEGADEPWRFHRKSVPARASVILAGPAANLVLAVLVYAFLFGAFGVERLGTTRIASVDPGSAAEAAGILGGDRIVAVDGKAVEGWEEVAEALEKAGEAATLTLRRGDEEVAANVALGGEGSVGLTPDVEARVGDVFPGGPADEAGLRKGDLILAIAGEDVDGWADLRLTVERRPGERVGVRFEREGKIQDAEVVLQAVEEKAEDGSSRSVGRLQVSPYRERVRLGPIAALREAVVQTAWVIGNVFDFLRLLVTGGLRADMVGGPVSIIHISGESARRGFDTVVSLLAFLSVELGILNLLPVPVLDGGHMLFLAIEAVRRRPLSVKQRLVLQQIGLALILVVMVTVTVYDVGRLVR
jgi:regulator of sigma E protease